MMDDLQPTSITKIEPGFYIFTCPNGTEWKLVNLGYGRGWGSVRWMASRLTGETEKHQGYMRTQKYTQGRQDNKSTVGNDLVQVVERTKSEVLERVLRNNQYSCSNCKDEGCMICDPHGCTNYMFKDNERYSCPHPECGSHDYSNSPDTAVRVEGGEDFCEHHSCTWVESDGVHFATAAEVCFCGRLVREHTKEEAQECLECLILNGGKGLDTEVQINAIVPYQPTIRTAKEIYGLTDLDIEFIKCERCNLVGGPGLCDKHAKMYDEVIE